MSYPTTKSIFVPAKVVQNYDPKDFTQLLISGHFLNLTKSFKTYKAKILKITPWLKNLPFLSIDTDVFKMIDFLIENNYKYEVLWSICFDRYFVIDYFYNGLLVIGSAIPHLSKERQYTDYLMPKLHNERCMVKLSEFHISKQVKKVSKHFTMTLDTCFMDVVKGCINQHSDAWLYPNIVASFYSCFSENSTRKNVKFHSSEVWVSQDKVRDLIKSGDLKLKQVWELLDEEGELDYHEGELDEDPLSDEVSRNKIFEELPYHPVDSPFLVRDGNVLVAGELGVTVGSHYISLTGFKNPYIDSVGSVQICALASLLKICGFEYLDFGMFLPYKASFGAKLHKTKDFIDLHRKNRDDVKDLRLNSQYYNCQDLIKYK